MNTCEPTIQLWLHLYFVSRSGVTKVEYLEKFPEVQVENTSTYIPLYVSINTRKKLVFKIFTTRSNVLTWNMHHTQMRYSKRRAEITQHDGLMWGPHSSALIVMMAQLQSTFACFSIFIGYKWMNAVLKKVSATYH